MDDPAHPNTATVTAILAGKEGAGLDQVVRLAFTDDAVLQQLLDGIRSPQDAVRFNCFKALRALAEEHPHRLDPHWDFLVGLLGSDNSNHRAIAVTLLARLAGAGDRDRFDPVLDPFLALLDDDSLVTARYVAQNAGRIARARPHLQARLTQRLLDIDATHHAKGRKELIKADIIGSFAEYQHVSPDRGRIVAFVEGCLHSSSPKTRAAAKDFMRQVPA